MTYSNRMIIFGICLLISIIILTLFDKKRDVFIKRAQIKGKTSTCKFFIVSLLLWVFIIVCMYLLQYIDRTTAMVLGFSVSYGIIAWMCLFLIEMEHCEESKKQTQNSNSKAKLNFFKIKSSSTPRRDFIAIFLFVNIIIAVLSYYLGSIEICGAMDISFEQKIVIGIGLLVLLRLAIYYVWKFIPAHVSDASKKDLN